MGAAVISGGKVRRITIKREMLEELAKLLDITPAERQQGSAIQITLSTPSRGKRAREKGGRGRQGK